MFKILAAVVATSLMITVSFAEDNDACDRIRSHYSASYSKLNTTCANLGHCQTLRTKCPQQTNDMGSCTVFNECMSEQFSDNATRASKCVYEWYTHPNSPGKCTNRNRSIDIVSKRCPGLSLFGDLYQDQNFNCDGHKGRYWGEHAEFRQAKRDYEQAMRDGVCHQVALPEPSSCAAAFRSVAASDNAHGGALEIQDGPRDEAGRMQSIFDFQSQFENYRLEAGNNETGASAQ